MPEVEYFCSDCNLQVSFEAKKCPRCGASLEETIVERNIPRWLRPILIMAMFVFGCLALLSIPILFKGKDALVILFIIKSPQESISWWLDLIVANPGFSLFLNLCLCYLAYYFKKKIES